ncbi:ribonuclease Y [Candidatus Dojkabacteria bacterium]|uniref:Ribonuclease Y n=1 Tax=Candidatus Dojkabacteria bacterium TaxID=2099670 RepID=A0A955KUR6_9BACT|nr:ribonuclease Y [Candidatus Dojkabacteria bacterium]MCB9791050.1 ribonuclease Y [Candidatus Nomurabacteria bacterium]
MDPISIVLMIVLTGAAIAGGIAYGKKSVPAAKPEDLPRDEVEAIAKKLASEIIEKAEQEAEQIKAKAEDRSRQLRREAAEQENLFVEREKALNKRSRTLDEKSEKIEVDEKALKATRDNIEETKNRLVTELEKISGFTREEAREKLMKEIDEEIKNYEAKLVRDAQKRAEETADEKAKSIIVESMQRIVTDYVGETTTSTIKIEDEKVKGRIIGRDGRNIRNFEKGTGVDVIVDDSPNTIVLSSFDPLRREIARVSMERLVKDGRIHPGTIEDEIRKAKNEIAAEIKKNGQILADEAGWPGIDMGLLKLIGKMKYRTSYGQSLMKHSIEVIRIGAMLAAEVGADVDLVKKACLLHDVGKVLTHKVEGAHHHISGQIARKYGLPDKLVNAIEAHHLDIEPQSVEAVLVYLADAVSGARPGARKDSYEQYIKRVEGIENAAKEVGGKNIDEVYAIHAGREVRVIVKPNKTSDEDIAMLAKDIADKIQSTQTYPGNVLVTVIRENRAEATAT